MPSAPVVKVSTGVSFARSAAEQFGSQVFVVSLYVDLLTYTSNTAPDRLVVVEVPVCPSLVISMRPNLLVTVLDGVSVPPGPVGVVGVVGTEPPWLGVMPGFT